MGMNKVLYNIDQRNDTSDAQKATARNNIGAASAVSLSEETARAIAAEVASATYDSENKLILFKNSANTQLFSLDATAFVMGGMIDSVVVEDGYLNITFITESGTETVSVDIGDIFDAENYYTKSETNSLLGAKQATVSTDPDESEFSGSTTIATGFSNNKVHLNTASRLWAWIKSQISSVLGLSEDNGTKTYSGTADTADKVNYDTITSGNAYVPVFDHNGKRLKVVAGSRGLIMQKASDGAYALLNCKAALAADADHAANSDNASYATCGADGTDIESYFTANTQNINDINTALGNKVDKVSGKGLSTNDFTNAYKNNVDSNTSARHTHSNKSVLDGISSTDVANWNTHSVVGVEADSTTAFDANTQVVVGYNGTSKKLKTRLASALMSFLGISESNNIKLFNGKAELAADADHANNANYSAYAVGIGSPNGHPAIGEDGRPIYINSNGIPTACTYKTVVGELGARANELYFF